MRGKVKEMWLANQPDSTSWAEAYYNEMLEYYDK